MSILTRFSPIDVNDDGINEIDWLRPLPFEPANGVGPRGANVVVVLVEDRLLGDLPASAPAADELLERLSRLKTDLRADGYPTWFLRAKVYSGPQHRDGRTLLAIREFLQAVQQDRDLAGVLLIGSFPDAMLVRRWLWRRDDANLTVNGTTHRHVNFLRVVPEVVAARADIVLADLEGNWSDIYQPGPMSVESIEAIPDNSVPDSWPAGNVTIESSIFNRNVITFEDFFWINDSDYTVLQGQPGKLRLRVRGALRHPEVATAELNLPNPLASPSLFVSRINARSIAAGPDPFFRDRNGRGFLSAGGRPQEVNAEAIPDMSWKRDPILERRLIIDFLDRNHAFRTGKFHALPRRTAAIAYPQRQFSADRLDRYLRRADSSIAESVVSEDGNLLEFVNWLKQPALLKGMFAHSSSWNTAYGFEYDREALEQATGRRSWRWQRQGSSLRFKPSFVEQGSAADLYLHRTIWENRVLRNAGVNFFLHMGCSVNSPQGATTRPYSHETYGGFQNAEGILFYLNGLALMARAKVFNDRPRGFSETLAGSRDAHFGGGWRAYFTEDANDASLLTKPSRCKRAYFWSVLGDWTLRLDYLRQDCIAIDPDSLRLEQSGRGWRVTDGRSWLKALATREDAQKVLAVMQFYGFTQQCFVGRPNAPLEYYLVDGKAPVGAMPGEDAMRIDPMACRVQRRGSRWFIMEGRSSWFSFSKQEQAEHGLSAMRRHAFSRVCFVDRPEPSLTYLRR